MVLPPFKLGVDCCQHFGRRSCRKIEGFGSERDRCRDRVPPTGGGEATSHSAPFQGRILFCAPQLAHVSDLAPCWSVSDYYFHHRHHGRLSGAVNAVWAVCKRTCSSWTSRLRASSSSAWLLTWVWSAVTKTSRLLSWPFGGWSFNCNSTSHRYPWGVGSLWASSSPLPMRLRIVSVDTPKRRAASPIDTFSTVFLLLEMGNSIGVYLGNRLGAAWASSGRFWQAVAVTASPHPRPLISREGEYPSFSRHPLARRARRLHGRSAGRRGPPHLLSGGLNVHGYIWKG